MKFFGLTLAVLLVSGFVFCAEARSVQKRNIFTDLLSHAKEAFNDAKTSIGNFFNGAITEQIQKARESFLRGLEALQDKAEDLIQDGVVAIHENIPGLQGIISERVDSVSAALDKYMADNSGKLGEVRELLLKNAQETLTLLKDRLHGAKTEEAVNQVVSSVDNIENQVVNEVTAAKSRSIFGINWSGLKQTIRERFDHLRNKFDEMLDNFRGNGQEDKIREQKNKMEEAMHKIQDAEKLPAPQKIEAVKEATAQLDQANEVAAAVNSEVEDSTSASA